MCVLTVRHYERYSNVHPIPGQSNYGFENGIFNAKQKSVTCMKNSCTKCNNDTRIFTNDVYHKETQQKITRWRQIRLLLERGWRKGFQIQTTCTTHVWQTLCRNAALVLTSFGLLAGPSSQSGAPAASWKRLSGIFQ